MLWTTLFFIGTSSLAQVTVKELRSGDVLLQPIVCDMCELIEKEENTAYAHAGLLIRAVDGAPMVAEAFRKTEIIPLVRFQKRTKKGHKIMVLRSRLPLYCGREKDCAKTLLSDFKKKYAGAAYDNQFLWDNKDKKGKELLYCSELITKLLRPYAPVPFPVKPMHFKKDRAQWNKKMGGKPPVDQVGNSPGDLERSSGWMKIGELGE
jgi:hypothetical protein